MSDNKKFESGYAETMVRMDEMDRMGEALMLVLCENGMPKDDARKVILEVVEQRCDDLVRYLEDIVGASPETVQSMEGVDV